MAREKELRRSLAVFPIGTVMKLTDLTARQIRYYEDQGLIQPEVRAQQKQVTLTDADVRRILHDELLQQGRFTTPSQQFGNLRI